MSKFSGRKQCIGQDLELLQVTAGFLLCLEPPDDLVDVRDPAGLLHLGKGFLVLGLVSHAVIADSVVVQRLKIGA